MNGEKFGMKPVSFSAFKKIQRLSLNEFNRWTGIIYKSGFQDAIDSLEEKTVAELNEDDLYDILLSVRGIGTKRAQEVMRKIIGEDWNESFIG